MKLSKYLMMFVGAIALVACGPQSDKQYETVNQAKWSKMTIEVHWVRKADISDTCKSMGTNDGQGTGEYNGCARSKPDDLSICEIYAVQPADFDDSAALQVFGHEAWHCFGAKHK